MTEFILIHSIDYAGQQPIYISANAIACFWKRNGVCAIRIKGDTQSMEVKESPEQIMELIKTAEQSQTQSAK